MEFGALEVLEYKRPDEVEVADGGHVTVQVCEARLWALSNDQLERAARMVEVVTDRAPIDGAGTDEQRRLTARTIAGVTEDLEGMRFNTAISKMMVFARDVAKDAPLARESAEVFTLLLAPMAPHLAEELWSLLGNVDTLAHEPWPEADESLLVDDEITLVVQVNGKKRGEIQVPPDISNEIAQERALAVENVQRILDGREPKKVIVVPGRLVNIVG